MTHCAKYSVFDSNKSLSNFRVVVIPTVGNLYLGMFDGHQSQKLCIEDSKEIPSAYDTHVVAHMPSTSLSFLSVSVCGLIDQADQINML